MYVLHRARPQKTINWNKNKIKKHSTSIASSRCLLGLRPCESLHVTSCTSHCGYTFTEYWTAISLETHDHLQVMGLPASFRTKLYGVSNSIIICPSSITIYQSSKATCRDFKTHLSNLLNRCVTRSKDRLYSSRIAV